MMCNSSKLSEKLEKSRAQRFSGSAISSAKLTGPYLFHVKKHGYTGTSAKKAPFLNFIKPDPFVVVPSGNIQSGLKSIPSFSIWHYLVLIVSSTLSLSSSDAPRGI